MIPNHAQFIKSIEDKKKVSVRFYSQADNGVVDRICAPINYGPGEIQDGLNRYWLWDYASVTGSHTLGLVPKQIVDLQVLGEVFDPAAFAGEPSTAPVAPVVGLPPATAISNTGATVPGL